MRNEKSSSGIAALAASLLIFTSASLPAENWAHWRGPNFDGSTSEKNLPEDFSKTNNVKWVAPMPGPSAATPIIWGDTVFVSSTDVEGKTLRALAFNRKTGKPLWNKEVAKGFSQDKNSNFASPSPTTDGKLVYFLYGTGDLAAFDFEGKPVWTLNLEKEYGQFAYQWTYGASPTLFALNPKTGKEIWKHVRPTEAAAESQEAYSTPIPFTRGGKTQILISGGDCLSGHDPETGKEIWRWGSWNPQRISHWRLVPSPVASEEAALVCAPKNSPVFAVKNGLEGKLDDSALAWTSKDREVTSDVCTPLLYKDRFYVLSGERRPRAITRIEPATGKSEWIGELDTMAKIECSPTAGDDKIYFQDFHGKVHIISTGKEFKVLRIIPMGDSGDDNLRAAVAIS
jgi:outer membrane protein assembly factor BamB